MLTCSKCKKEKDVGEFYKDSSKKTGKCSTCKVCSKARVAKWTQDNPKQAKKNSAEYTSRHKTEILQKSIVWYWNNRARVKTAQLKRIYNISSARFQETVVQQEYKCRICKRPFTKDLLPVVDHDHSCCPGPNSCGKCVRGLLCSRCNHMLGHSKDNTSNLEEAVRYLNYYRGNVNEGVSNVGC